MWVNQDQGILPDKYIISKTTDCSFEFFISCEAIPYADREDTEPTRRFNRECEVSN